MKLKSIGAAAAGAVLAVTFQTSTAHASNPVIHHHWGSAKYIDLTDQLCVRVADYMGPNNWATAKIKKNGATKFKITKSGNRTNNWKCTKNLSIAEDVQFNIVIESCTTYANPACSSKRKSFYS